MRRFCYVIVLFFIFNISLFAKNDKSLIVLDTKTNKVLIEEKSNKKYKIASLTKIWTALREPLIINYQEHFSNLSRNFS